MGWGFRYHIPYATALAMRGATEEAAAVLAALDEARRPFRKLDYERSLARAWVVAGQGAITEAITTLLSAAESAAAKGQFAAEVVCLQTAVQFGDHSAAPRLTELESIVEGPRVKLASRFAAALAGSDAPELEEISVEFEQMGDLVAAVDAAAHACLAFRHGDRRGSALGCSARAEALAQRCGGISTPALREVSEPLPLTATRARDHPAPRVGVFHSRRRRAALRLGPHRRGPHLPGHDQDGGGNPRRTHQAAISRPVSIAVLRSIDI